MDQIKFKIIIKKYEFYLEANNNNKFNLIVCFVNKKNQRLL